MPDPEPEAPPTKLSTRDWFALATGLNLSFALCYLSCKPPLAHALSWPHALSLSLSYLLLACIIGAFGTWLTLPPGSPELGSRSRFGLRAWLFLPAIALFLQEQSLGAPLLAAIVATLLALHLTPQPPTQPPPPTPLFAHEIATAPASLRPFAFSLCLYAALAAELAGRLMLVTLFLAAAVFLLTLHLTATQTKPARQAHPYALAAAALCFTFLALSSTHIWRDPLLGRTHLPISPAPSKGPAPDHTAPGYTTIVLWPPHERKKTIPPPPRTGSTPAPGSAQPWIIPFDGPYWYFKVPGIPPGPEARTTHGDPLKVNVRSSDRNQLFMEAHQTLAAPVPLSCCRQIQLVFHNDPALGAIAVGLSLADTHSPTPRSQDLGAQNIASTRIDPSPHDETLTFLIPKRSILTQFDAITVTLLPSPDHRTAGRRVSIDKFVMIPN
jgi:hypothetical protein